MFDKIFESLHKSDEGKIETDRIDGITVDGTNLDLPWKEFFSSECWAEVRERCKDLYEGDVALLLRTRDNLVCEGIKKHAIAMLDFLNFEEEILDELKVDRKTKEDSLRREMQNKSKGQEK